MSGPHEQAKRLLRWYPRAWRARYGEEFAELFRWLSEKDWERWDKEIEADSQAGRLDFLEREAREEKAKGTLKGL